MVTTAWRGAATLAGPCARGRVSLVQLLVELSHNEEVPSRIFQTDSLGSVP